MFNVKRMQDIMRTDTDVDGDAEATLRTAELRQTVLVESVLHQVGNL